MSILVVILHYQ